MPLCVGVFANKSAASIKLAMDQASFDAAQLHGDETPAEVSMVGTHAFKVIRLVNVQTQEFITAANVKPGLPSLMIDANHPTLYGGTGMRADESSAAQLARTCDLLLAGGLTPDNVADAIRIVRPWGVDVASGTEQSLGVKDHDKVRAFIAAATGVSSSGTA